MRFNTSMVSAGKQAHRLDLSEETCKTALKKLVLQLTYLLFVHSLNTAPSYGIPIPRKKLTRLRESSGKELASLLETMDRVTQAASPRC